MNNYYDEYARLHNSPVTIEKPLPSNNAWLFTAIAQKLGLPVDSAKVAACFELCSKNNVLLRHPGDANPPISRDEILGLAELKLLKPSHLNGWSFSPFPIPKVSALALAKQLYELRPNIIPLKNVYDKNSKAISYKVLGHAIILKHRNYFWQNKLDQIYRFAFSVPVADRYFLLKNWDTFHFYNPVHIFYYLAAKIDSMIGKGSGIRYVKYGGEKNKLSLLKRYPSDHPIVEKVNGL